MDNMFSTNFSSFDWGIVIVYLSLAVVVGIFANKFIHNVKNYMVGGRSSGAWLNASSYIGTLTALSVVMYSAQDGFSRGFCYMIIPLIGMVTCIILGSTGFVVKKLRQLNLTTIPEYFEIRYNRQVRVTAGIICAVAGTINMGLFPKVGAIFITYCTGIADSTDNPVLMVNMITSLLIILVLFYTMLGGMISVILTDFLQYIVISLGIAIGLYFCLSHPAIGWNNMVNVMKEYRGEAAFNPVHQDSYGWTYVVWQVILIGSAVIAWAPEASRMLTAKDYKATMRTFLLGSPAWIVGWAIPALWGIAAFTLFVGHPELGGYFMPDGPTGEVQHAASALPLLLGKIIPSGFLGIFAAGMLAAFMSTHDSYFLCWASVIVRDVVNPLRSNTMSGTGQIRLTRIIILIMGAFLLAWGVWYDLPASVWTYMAVTGNIFLSGAAVALIGGIYWHKASSVGALAALLGGLTSIAGLFVGPIQAVLPWISEGVIGLSSYVASAVLFVVFSLMFPDPFKTKQERLKK